MYSINARRVVHLLLNICGNNIFFVSTNKRLDQRHTPVHKDRRSGDRIQVEARFIGLVQNDPGTHPASYTIGSKSHCRR